METETKNIYSHFFASGSKLEPAPFSTEHRMSVYLSENPEILTLRDGEDVEIRGLEKQWVRSETGKGRIDFLVSYGDSYAVVELKKGELDESAFDQLKSYMNEDFLLNVGKDFSNASSECCQWEGVLVGASIKDELKQMITEHNKSSKIPFSAIVLKRYKSGEQFYTITDIFFPNKTEKDRTKFFFNGALIIKSRIVLAMVKDYVDRNPDLKVSDLKSILSSITRSGKPIVEDFELVDADSKRFHHFLLGDKYAVALCDGVVSVQGFWTKDEMSIVERIKDVLGCNYTLVS